jgi:hypothetical protein
MTLASSSGVPPVSTCPAPVIAYQIPSSALKSW